MSLNVVRIFVLLEGDVKAYLGISVKREKDGTINMTQQALTERIIKALNLEEESKTHDTEANVILQKGPDGPDRNKDWNYQSIVGMMTFLAGATHPDILFAVHQCSTFNQCQKEFTR